MSATIPTIESVADDMSGDGFQSPLLDQFIPNIVAAHPEWFNYARRLNRVAMTMWSNHPSAWPVSFRWTVSLWPCAFWPER